MLSNKKIQTIKNVRSTYDLSLMEAHNIVSMWASKHESFWDRDNGNFKIDPEDENEFEDFVEKCVNNLYTVRQWKKINDAKYIAMNALDAGFRIELDACIKAIFTGENNEPF